ncbi:MAG TPA: cytochrome P450, partial [Nonomuraea sp.]|nr:cytochrome P450 [Nonomuraea sp.]
MSTAHVIVQAPGGVPFLGHAMSLLRDPLAFLESMPAFGDLVRLRLGPLEAILVCEPALTRQVLLDDRTFDKGGPLFDRAQEVFGVGLASCPHSLHRRQRRLAQPTFQPGRFPAYARTMTAQIAAVVDGWHDGQILDVPAEMAALTMRIALETMFSGALTPQALHRSVADLATVAGGIYRRTVLPPSLNRLPTPANRRYTRAGIRLRQTVSDIIAHRRSTGTDHGDLLSALLEAGDAPAGRTAAGDGSPTDVELRDQVITFLGAGSETTANTLAWALYALARDPDLEARVHAEVDAVLAGAPAGLDHLTDLDLTGRVITETLRMYSPAWLITRIVSADTHLGGHPIPAGTTIICSPYLIHHRGDLHDGPDTFDPDRWESSRRPHPPREAFIPFG